MHQKSAEIQVGWMSWGFWKLSKELFFKYEPFLATQFPTLQSRVLVKVMYLSMTLLGTLFLNAVFFSTSGIPKDGSCSNLDPLLRQIAVTIYSAAFLTGVITCLQFWLMKSPVYKLLSPAEKLAQLRAWRRREYIAFSFSAVYCAFCTVYACAFGMVINEDAFAEFLQGNLLVYLLLLVVKPLVLAVALGMALSSSRRTIVASYAPGLCDFSHLTALSYADRCKIQQFLATMPPKDAQGKRADPERTHTEESDALAGDKDIAPQSQRNVDPGDDNSSELAMEHEEVHFEAVIDAAGSEVRPAAGGEGRGLAELFACGICMSDVEPSKALGSSPATPATGKTPRVDELTEVEL
jgi:hypothetical protein